MYEDYTMNYIKTTIELKITDAIPIQAQAKELGLLRSNYYQQCLLLGHQMLITKYQKTQLKGKIHED